MHKLVAFEWATMQRSELNPAPYNPQTITTERRKKLRRGLKKLGLLEPIVHNKRTGVLVGGHKRLKELDKSAGYPPNDYSLPVAVVDLSEADERAANILLNNPEAQGDYDLDKLWELMRFPEIDTDATGFDTDDIYKLFGASPFAAQENVDRLAEVNERLLEAAERYRNETKAGAKTRDSEHFYWMVICKDAAARDKFTAELGIDDNRYQDARVFIAAVRRAQAQLTESTDEPDR